MEQERPITRAKRSAQSAKNNAGDGSRNSYSRDRDRAPFLVQKASKKVDSFFREEFGAEIDSEDVYERLKEKEELEALASVEVKKPHFPFFMFYIALCLDLIDFVQLTGVGVVVMWFVNIAFFFILYFWMRGKVSRMFKFGSRMIFKGKGRQIVQRQLNRVTKRMIGRYVSRRLAAILIVNVIPFIGVLASWAFFVFLAHNRQKKIAQSYMFIIEEAGKALKAMDRSQRN